MPVDWFALCWAAGSRLQALAPSTSRSADTLHRHAYDSEGTEVGEEPVALEELPPLSRIVRDVEFYARYLSGTGGPGT